MMLAREELAIFLLNRDEGGDSLDWATHFVRSAINQEHEGDCRLAKNPAPFTCSRCVVDGALRDADSILTRAAAVVVRAQTIEECANIALAIDSGRGNEKEIARAIRRLSPDTSIQDCPA